jgi:hypothetical protein
VGLCCGTSRKQKIYKIMIKIIQFTKAVPYVALDRNKFELLDKVETEFSINDNNIKLEVEPPFIWDGATIPRLFWSIIGYYPTGIMLAASLWHDYIYINKGNVADTFISREDSDKLFLEHMLDSGVKEKSAKLMYNIVRKFGWIYWTDNTITRRFLR